MVLMLGGWSAHAEMSRLDAIAMIETGHDDRAVGKAGEISRYQIKPSVWKKYSRSRSYRDPRVSSRVAQLHLESLENGFRERTGREASDFDRYVLWNAGLAYYSRRGFSHSRIHPVIRERATRYVNLCGEDPARGKGGVSSWSPEFN